MRGRYVAGKTQTMRATMTVRLTATAEPDELAGAVGREVVQDDGQLQSDEHEHEAVDEEVDDRTRRRCRCSRPSGDSDARGAPPGDEPGGHGREHPADADGLGRRGTPRSGAMSERTISSVGSPVRRQAAGHEDADDDADERSPPTPTTTNDTLASSGRERAGDDRRDGDAVGDQRRRVVDQALALEDRDDPARDAEPAQDRGRRHGVGRRDDGAQGERRRPLQRRARGARRRAPTTSVVNSTSPMASRTMGRALALKSRIGVK